MELKITLNDAKAKEALDLFCQANPCPKDVPQQTWVERCLTDYLKAVLEQSMYQGIRAKGLLNSQAYFE